MDERLRLVIDDLSIISRHIYTNSEAAVRKWTDIQCNDYQIPLALIDGFLIDAYHRDDHKLRIRARPEYQAVVAIVENSHLTHLLEFAGDILRYRSEVPSAVKQKIAEFLADQSTAIE